MIPLELVPFAIILGVAMTIGLLFLKPRNLDDELHEPGKCSCYGCRTEWADNERTPQD